MSNGGLNVLLAEIHEELARTLLNKIRSGEITPAELQCARQFLKDNGIDSVPQEDNTIGMLVSDMPFDVVDGGSDIRYQ